MLVAITARERLIRLRALISPTSKSIASLWRSTQEKYLSIRIRVAHMRVVRGVGVGALRVSAGAMRIRVVAGVIERGGEILCAQRGTSQRHAGMWELPGGKVEPGESDAEALVRELEEELGVIVRVGEQLGTSDHDYPGQAIRLVAYRCTIDQGQPVASEHAEIRWVAPGSLAGLDWAPADRPLVRRL